MIGDEHVEVLHGNVRVMNFVPGSAPGMSARTITNSWHSAACSASPSSKKTNTHADLALISETP